MIDCCLYFLWNESNWDSILKNNVDSFYTPLLLSGFLHILLKSQWILFISSKTPTNHLYFQTTIGFVQKWLTLLCTISQIARRCIFKIIKKIIPTMNYLNLVVSKAIVFIGIEITHSSIDNISLICRMCSIQPSWKSSSTVAMIHWKFWEFCSSRLDYFIPTTSFPIRTHILSPFN